MTTWWTGLPDRSGMAKYVVLIRGKDDPKRAPRPGLDVDPGHATRWKEVNKTPPEEWRKIIMRHMQDGQERTWNRIVVEITGAKYTADTVFDKNPEKGLWLAVERGELEYTPEAPILFRIRTAGAKKGRAKLKSSLRPGQGTMVDVEGEMVQVTDDPFMKRSEDPYFRSKTHKDELARSQRMTGKTVQPAPAQKRVRGFAVYDMSTIKKQRAGQRLPPVLLLKTGDKDGPKTLEQAIQMAKTWTVGTGHATTVKEDGIPVFHASWTPEMVKEYTKGWVQNQRVSDERGRTGTFSQTKPTAGGADSGYLAGVVWDGDKGLSWVPLTSIRRRGGKTEYVPPRAPPKAKEPRIRREITTKEAHRKFEDIRKKPKAERRVTAKDITDPVLGGAKERLQAAVEDAIRRYGGGRKKR